MTHIYGDGSQFTSFLIRETTFDERSINNMRNVIYLSKAKFMV